MVRPILIVVAAVASLAGCKTFQPLAHRGHDLLDNPGRGAAVRIPAGLGAMIGHALALPFSVLLFPSYFCEDAVVENADQLATTGSTGREGELYIPWVLAPFEYGSGAGSAILATPCDWLASLFREEEPGPPPGTVLEQPELPPGVIDPRLRFEVQPPRPQAPPASTPAPAPAPTSSPAPKSPPPPDSPPTPPTAAPKGN